MKRNFSKPPRLPVIIQSQPLFFVTFCTMHRKCLLANAATHEAFCRYAQAGLEHGAGVGQYVLMPEHIHLFVRMSGEMTLGRWVGGLKRAIGEVLEPKGDLVWQPGFFDHLLRHDESYSEKWAYVRDNPVRKNLAANWADWPYRGEIVVIDRA
jgi:REP element-mobilizing transposase RayT